MIKEGKYTLSELRVAIKESAKNEFKPKFGDKVESDNEKNNKEAVKDITKEVEKYNPDGIKPEIALPVDRNKTTLDLKFNEMEPGKEWRDRVEAQVHGFPSVTNEETSDAKENGGLDYEGNKKFFDHREEMAKERQDATKDDKDAGLRGRELKKYNTEPGSLFEGKKWRNEKERRSMMSSGVINEDSKSNTMKRLNFKSKVFLNENEIKSYIPESYKTDGNKFYVKDASGTQYMVECVRDKQFGFMTVNIVNRLNENKEKAQIERMKSLFNYNSSDYFGASDKGGNNVERLHEGIEKIRDIEKTNK